MGPQTRNSMPRHLAPGLFLMVLPLAPLPADADQTSALWGDPAAPTWNPATSRLPDFTHVGYMQGAVPIPDWPVGVNVTDPAFGAVPDDDIDDSQAFIDAIAACPDHHAVFVPRGRYLITQQIKPQRNHFVLRGEDMYGTELFFPKYLDEAYINEIGWSDDGARNTGNPEGFITMDGGTEKSIENLSLVFREQRKGGVWEYLGADPLCYTGDVTHSWVRNVRIRNYDLGFKVTRASNLSVINLKLDQFPGRRSIVGSAPSGPEGTVPLDEYGEKLGIPGFDALFGVMPRRVENSLFHNIEVDGYVMQPIDMNESPNNNVFSGIRARLRAVGYHGGGSTGNLYTDMNNFVSGVGNDTRTFETYWGVDFFLPEKAHISDDSNIFVGYGASNDEWPAKMDPNDPTIWYEPIAASQLTPRNLYLAQLAHLGKPLPDGPPPAEPSPYDADVFRVHPTDDIHPNGEPNDGALAINGPYLKFDLAGIDVSAVEHARLRINLIAIRSTPFELTACRVDDDNWTEATVTPENKPLVGAPLDTLTVGDGEVDRVLEFDVTPFVREQLVGGDGVVSLCITKTGGNGIIVYFRSLEGGIRPELVVERVPSSVPGAPGAPKGIHSTPMIGNIILDWDDNPEADVATYNVYRDPLRIGSDGYQESHASGLITSDFVDIESAGDWKVGMMDHRQVYKYRITAVDDHGYESPRSMEFVAATLHPTNSPPAFNDSVALAGATTGIVYNGSLASEASDPESDPMYFMKVSGPDWLNVALDGTLGGEPGPGDVGANTFTFQVTAIGGSTIKENVTIVVEALTDNPPGAPASPTGFNGTVNENSVELSWNAGSETDIYGYRIFRAATSGAYGSEPIALVRGVSNFTDLGLSNGTTYYYVVTAIDAFDNESAQSAEISAAIAPTPTNDTSFTDADPANSQIGNVANWDNGLPGLYNPGTIPIGTMGVDFNVSPADWSVTQEDGALATTTFRQFNGGSWVMDGGSISLGNNFQLVTADDKSHTFTVNAGASASTTQTLIVSSAGTNRSAVLNISGGSVSTNQFQVNSGGTVNFTNGSLNSTGTMTINAGGVFHMTNGTRTGSGSITNSGTLTISGGNFSTDVIRNITTNPGGKTTISGGTVSIGSSIGRSIHGAGAYLFEGGVTTCSSTINPVAGFSLTLGGSSAGSLAATAWGGTAADRNVNWLPGSGMSVTLSGVADWAETEWNAGRMTFHGAGLATLGSWAAVTTPRGLDGIHSFAYDSASRTLSLLETAPLPNPEYTDAELWRLLYFEQSENSGIAADDIDFDHDGLSNLLERAFGTSPIDNSDWFAMPGAGLVRQGDAEHLSITYRQLRGGTGTTGIDYKASGITYTVEHDADLDGPWNMGSVVPVADPTNNGDGTETVTVRLTEDVTSGNSKFMRLKISADP